MAEAEILLWVILGALAGIVWSLRKIYVLEKAMIQLEMKMDMLLEHHKIPVAKKRKK
jgi:hypothetical protein